MAACFLFLVILTAGLSLQRAEEGENKDPCQTSDYKLYPHSTKYKTVPDYIAWDRVNHTACDLHINTLACLNLQDALKNQHCGDCDYELEPEVWYKFAEPNDRIVVVEAVEDCPPQGHCNGYYPLTLLASKNSDLFYLVKSGHVDKDNTRSCIRFGNEANENEMVHVKTCSDGVILYKFPVTYSNKTQCSNTFDCKNEGDKYPLFTPASWCLTGNETGPIPGPVPTPQPQPQPKPEPKPNPEPTDSDPVSKTFIGINSAASFLVLLILILFAAYKCHSRKVLIKPDLPQVESRPGPEPDLPEPDLPEPDLPEPDLPVTNSPLHDSSGPALPEPCSSAGESPASESIPNDTLQIDSSQHQDLPEVEQHPDLEAASGNLSVKDIQQSLPVLPPIPGKNPKKKRRRKKPRPPHPGQNSDEMPLVVE